MTVSHPKQALKEFLDPLSNRMYSALNAYWIWRSLDRLININYLGRQKAEENVDIINKYGYFFHQVSVSTYKSFVADLAIFFDAEKYGDSISIGKVLNELSKYLTVGELDAIRSKVEEIKHGHRITIYSLLELRNTDVAHQEFRPEPKKISYEHFDALFVGVQEILNLLYQHYDGSYTVWDHLPKEITHTTERLIETIREGDFAQFEKMTQRTEIEQ